MRHYSLTFSRTTRSHERRSPVHVTGEGVAVRHHFPLDGEYVLKIRLVRTANNGVIKGLQRREQLDVRLDGVRLKLFNVGGECVDSKEPKCIKATYIVLRSSEYERTADAALEVRFAAKAGPRIVGIAFARRNEVKEGAGPERLPAGGGAHYRSETAAMSLDSVDLEGPFNATGPGDTPSRRKILICRPVGPSTEEPCAKNILTTLARRAYRRPVTDRDVERLLRFYRTGRSNGDFETGVRFALERLLVSPSFLLRIDSVPSSVTSGTSRTADVELASRLSFFLWSSIPDDELLDIAARGKLSDPATLAHQVRRMLVDPRATSLVTNFASQWLHLRDLRKVAPDADVYPDFDDSLRVAFERETELFLESQLREDRPLIELLTAKYTFVNERLARFYDIPNVYGSHFRRVTMSDPSRSGLLGHASILTVTSYSTRTSPVVRGQYVLSNFLGSPPPPPPPNVPVLSEGSTGGDGKPASTIRTRLEAHRKNPACAGCHARMDPLGFALENFNAIGKWRTTDGGAPIDPTGAFPDGTKFSNPAEFHQALLSRRDEFVRNVTEKLLTYALGRGVEYYDMPAVRTIVRDAAVHDYRWSSLILGIIKSAPFQMRDAPKRGQELVQRNR